MTTQLELAAPPPAPPPARGRSWGQAIDLGVRAALLFAIGLSWLVVLPSHVAAQRDVAAFTAALREHRVSSVEYLDKSRTVRWSEGWLHWYQTDLFGVVHPAAASSEFAGQSWDDAQVGVDLTWLQDSLSAADSRLHYRQVADGSSASWWRDAPWPLLSSIAAVASGVAFLLMLGRERRRFASRWGWFWLFAIDGVAGPLLFLLLEPAPLWRRNPNDRPFPPRPAARGGVGLLVAVGLRVLLPMVWGFWLLFRAYARWT